MPVDGAEQPGSIHLAETLNIHRSLFQIVARISRTADDWTRVSKGFTQKYLTDPQYVAPPIWPI